MEGQEESPARGLKGMLSRTRRGKDDGGQASMPEPSDRRLSRGDSSESTPEKFKPRPANPDAEHDQPEAKMSKLLPGRGKRKDKQSAKFQQGTEAKESEREEAQSRNVTKGPSLSLSLDDNGNLNGHSYEGEEGSLMTSESESELNGSFGGPHLNAPTLRSRESHSGYLTLSSPQVKAIAVDEPVTIAESGPTGAIAGASTLSVNSTGSGSSNRSRSKSPGAKLKEALKPSTKKAKETRDLKTSPSLTDLAGDNDDTIASRRLSKGVTETAASHPYVQTSNAHASQSNKSLPSIVMTPETPPPIPESPYAKVPSSVLPSVEKDDLVDNPIPETGIGKPMVPPFMNLQHRRARSASQTPPPPPPAPSRTSQSVNPPLTPMIEEVKTPPSRHASTTSSGGGFFSSMFNVAQNAASTLTTTLTNTGNRPRSSTTQTQQSEDDKNRDQTKQETEPLVPANSTIEEAIEQTKPMAIDTIGTGELSLSHLGISTEPMTGPSILAPSIPGEAPQSRSRSGTVIRREEAAAREEVISAARAVSAAYEEKPEDVLTPMVEEVAPEPKTNSIREGSIGERNTTPNGSVIDGETGGLFRSTSIKNKIDRKRRRHGGSQSTVGAALAQSGSSLINATNHNGHKLTGFAVASKKRNRDFHALFRSVPEDDYLIEDYSCALQRDIILAGRIYISEGHICFSSNILGWVTTLVISFDEVVSVEKENTAMVFPNAIAVQTLHARHTFRSLLSRETTYDLLIGIWKINHPGLMSSENGVRVASGTGSKTEKLENDNSDNDSGASDEDDVDDEEDTSNASEGGDGSSIVSAEGGAAQTEAAASPPKSSIPQKSSNLGVAAGQASAPPTVVEAKAAAQANGATMASGDHPGPQTHAPTECIDQATHYPNLLKDETIPAPLGKIFSLTFGNASGGFMSRWLIDEMKVTELQMEDDKKGLSDENKTRTFSYIKPLGGSIGPKQTKCITSEQLDFLDLEKAVSVTVTTQTPDVPSGNVFSVKTRYCLMWGPNNSTRMIMNCAIEWTGKSWLKGPIEKGANDGQVSYANDLYKALRAAVSKGKPTAAGTPSGKSRKSKKKRGSGDAEKSSTSLTASTAGKKADWGLFEPLHSIFGPVTDLLGPVLSVNVLVGVMLLLLAYSWIRGSSSNRVSTHGLPSTPHSARLAAYEELWHSEEDALWNWLEERIGGDEGLAIPIGKGQKGGSKSEWGKKPYKKQGIRDLDGNLMGDKEVERALELTEEKLRVLKNAVNRVKAASSSSEGKSEL